MKKLFALLTAVVMVVCLCACGGNSEGGKKDNSSALVGEWTLNSGEEYTESFIFYETGDVKYVDSVGHGWMGTYTVLSDSDLLLKDVGNYFKNSAFTYEIDGDILRLTLDKYRSGEYIRVE